MNFEHILPVEKPESYLDSAFSVARSPKIKKQKDRVQNEKTRELAKISSVTRFLTKSLERLYKSFPSLDRLDTFYSELLKSSLDYGELRRSLGGMNWAAKTISLLGANYLKKIKRTQSIATMKKQRTEFYGRISSVIKQLRPEFEILWQARKKMRRFPDIDTTLPTVAISGYPNVGKSSLLGALTSSTPEVKEYAYTTKSLNLGYIDTDRGKLQLVDTPGAFDRNLEEMNSIEKQAYLVIQHVADMVLFIKDISPSSAYPVKDQDKLLSRLRRIKKPVLVAFGKADMLEDKKEKGLYVSPVSGEGMDILREKLTKMSLTEKKETYSKGKDHKA